MVRELLGFALLTASLYPPSSALSGSIVFVPPERPSVSTLILSWMCRGIFQRLRCHHLTVSGMCACTFLRFLIFSAIISNRVNSNSYSPHKQRSLGRSIMFKSLKGSCNQKCWGPLLAHSQSKSPSLPISNSPMQKYQLVLTCETLPPKTGP